MAIVVVVAALVRVVVLVAAGVGTAGKLAGWVMGVVKAQSAISESGSRSPQPYGNDSGYGFYMSFGEDAQPATVDSR